MGSETFMVTGALGCIGAWVLRNLVGEGVKVVATDLAGDPVRPRQVIDPQSLQAVTFAHLDVTDKGAVDKLVGDHGITHIIHLAGLQVPSCRSNPSLGAQVNVVGTVNILEAARRHWGQVRGVAYASSLAVLGPPGFYPPGPITDDAPLHPLTLYGVYKQANEHTARIFWQDWQIPTVGLRPYIVYGVGRDQGLTSDIAKATLAVAASRPFHIKFSGPVALQHADDVARIFIASARATVQGALTCNLRNDVLDVAAFVELLKQEFPGSRISAETDRPLPFPYDLDDAGLRRVLGTVPHTPLIRAIREDVGRFQALLQRGEIDLAQLEGS